MDGENRMYTAVWLSAFIALVAAIFLIGGCIKDEARIEASKMTQCVRAGGSYVPARGTSSEMECVANGQR